MPDFLGQFHQDGAKAQLMITENGVDATCPHELFHRSKDSYSALDHKNYLQTLSSASYDVLNRHRVRAVQSHILVRHIHPEYLR